jgi:predicted regulator of Ras-like GTPase activity (Roadblock/LC7/MglB family)
MKLGILAALLVMLLFFGCVEERQVSITGYEEIEGISSMDITGDGAGDLYVYSYLAKPVDDAAGISMKKVVVAYPATLSAKINVYDDVSPEKLAEAKALIKEFGDAKTLGEASCFTILGLDRAKCTGDETCLEACKSSVCERIKAYGPETLGYELYRLNEDSRDVDELVAELQGTTALNTQEEKDQFASKIATLMGVGARMNANLVFRTEVYGACAMPPFKAEKLKDAIAKVGTVEVQKNSYEYKTVILFDGGKEDLFIELYVKDSPPLNVDVDELSLDILENGRLYEKEPLTVGWDDLSLDQKRKIAYYDFAASTEPNEEIMAKWKYPRVRERNLMALAYIYGFYTNPAGQFFFGVLQGAFSIFSFLGYFAALGAALSVWVVIFFLFIFLLETLYHVARAVMDRRNIRRALIEAFGAPLTDWRTYIGVGAILIIVSILLNIFYTAPVEAAGLELESIAVALSSDLVGSACVVLFVLGAYTLFLVAEDWLKGRALGREYYDLRGATKEDNIRELAKLRETWQMLRMRVEDLSKTGMVVTEEYAIIVSVPIERLEQMVTTDKQSMAKQLIRFNQERLDMLEQTLNEKVNVMNQKWPEWKEELGRVTAESEVVPLNTLLAIPMQWREWAVEKFISENRTKGFALEGDSIVRKKVNVGEAIEKKMKDLMKTKVVEHAVLLSQDEQVYTSFPKGRKTLVAALFIKMKTYVNALAKKMGANDVKRFVVSGKGLAGVYLSHGNYQAFMMADKAKIKDIIDEWNVMAEKFA